jgi:hypothetical protein
MQVAARRQAEAAQEDHTAGEDAGYVATWAAQDAAAAKAEADRRAAARAEYIRVQVCWRLTLVYVALKH